MIEVHHDSLIVDVYPGDTTLRLFERVAGRARTVGTANIKVVQQLICPECGKVHGDQATFTCQDEGDN